MTKPRFTLHETNVLSMELIKTIKLKAVKGGMAKDLNDYASTHPYVIGYLESFISTLMLDNPELVAEVQRRIRNSQEQA